MEIPRSGACLAMLLACLALGAPSDVLAQSDESGREREASDPREDAAGSNGDERVLTKDVRHVPLRLLVLRPHSATLSELDRIARSLLNGDRDRGASKIPYYTQKDVREHWRSAERSSAVGVDSDSLGPGSMSPSGAT